LQTANVNLNFIRSSDNEAAPYFVSIVFNILAIKTQRIIVFFFLRVCLCICVVLRVFNRSVVLTVDYRPEIND